MRNKILLVALTIALFATIGTRAENGGKIEYDVFPATMLQGVEERNFSVYLLENYENESDKVFPVLYLLHGGFGSYKDWPAAGNLKATADQMIATGEISEMVIICPDGRYRDNTMWFDMDGWMAEEHFFNELIPYMESRYRIQNDKSGRAIAGLSLGGGAALGYAIDHPDIFSASCGKSAYIRSVAKVVNPGIAWIQPAVNRHNPIERLNAATEADIARWKTVDWLIDCGDKDFTIQSNTELDETMNAICLPHEFLMRKGMHNWNYWNSSLPIVLKFINTSFAE